MITRPLHRPTPIHLITLPTSPYPGRIPAPGLRPPSSRRRLLGHFQLPSSAGQAYHVMSRTTGGDFLFHDAEKEAFSRLLWRLARFSGIQVLTFAILDNHFHLLLKVPDPQKFLARFDGPHGERLLLQHLALLYSPSYLQFLQQELTRLRELGLDRHAQLILDSFRKRFCNLSLFVKELKERFSRWFNRRHQRRGTLWMDRFKSVLVEDGDALRTMALYIDLNPVRAGIVDDPKDYRWTGYGAACAGSKRARRGLCRVMDVPLDHWNHPIGGITPAEAYRCWLFGEGLETASPPNPSSSSSSRRGIPATQVRSVLQSRGKLSRAELLRGRVHGFSDGVAIGSRDFIESIFTRHRDRFGPCRQTGARRIRDDASGQLYSLRDLRRSPLTDPHLTSSAPASPPSPHPR